MNVEDYNQIILNVNALDNPGLLKEGEVVTILLNSEDGMPLSVDMPASLF